MNSDLRELFALLNANDVEFIVVGAHALARYVPARYTADFDLWIKPEPDNIGRLYKALVEFGVAPNREELNKLASPKRTMFTMGAEPFAVDLLNFLTGCDFDEAWENAEVDDLLDVPVKYLSKKDLITTKRETGRNKDLRDLDDLLKNEN